MITRVSLTFVLTTIVFSLFGQVLLSTNKTDARYNIGETINFVITGNQTGTANYTIRYDKYMPIETGSIFVQAGVPATISYTSNEPSVIGCVVNLNGIGASASATVDPFNIQPLEAEPGDFDSYWANQKAQLAGVPMNANVSLYQTSTYSTTYKVNLAHIDNRRVYGYMTVPNGNGNYPAVLTMPSFGEAPNTVAPEPTFAEQSNAITMVISIHNADLNAADPNAYEPNNYIIREENYNRYAVLAGIRAIDYLTSRPDVDQSKIGIFGTSQGGGLAMIISGIDNRVKVCMNTISILCEHAGRKYGRGSGFPYYLNNAIGMNFPQEQALAAVKYYDAVYAAKRFKGQVLMNISYLDNTTPPATNFAAWNQFTGNNKILIHAKKLDHVSPGRMWEDRFKLLRRVWPSATANPLFPYGDTTSKGHWANAGTNKTTSAGTPLSLSGTVEFNNSSNFSWPVQWEKVSGPGNVNFSSSNNRNTNATFSSNGVYILRFRAEDNQTYANENVCMTMEDFVQVTVEGNTNTQQNQSISFSNISDKLTTDNPFNIFATASSGLPVSYNYISGPASLSNNTITLSGQPGTVTISATQNGNNNFYAAPTVTRSFQVTEPDNGEENGGGNNNCTDSDNDGTCDVDDCFVWNPNLPAAPGTPCNDYDPHNSNDVIQADGCTCEGTDSNSGGGDNGGGNNNCTDSDNDGTCDVDDCFIWNPNLPAAPGTPCNDFDPHNFNDVIQADGCTCEGTDSNSGGGDNSNCSNPTLVSQGKSTKQSSTLNVTGVSGDASKAVDGNTSGNFWSGSVSATTNSYQPWWEVDLGASYDIEEIKVWNRTEGSDRLTNFHIMVSDNSLSSDLNSATGSANWSQHTTGNAGTPSNYNMSTSGRYVRIQAAQNSYLTLAEVQVYGCSTNSGSSGGTGEPISNCTDSDNDGTCDADDCFIWNPNLPAAPGTPCNDYDPHNFNDVIQADGCTCEGTDSNSGGGGTSGGNSNCTDSDNDGTCDVDDCFIWNPNLPAAPGTPCNDYDPHNFNDVIQADGCTCEGTDNNSGGGNNGGGDITYCNGTGNSSSYEYIERVQIGSINNISGNNYGIGHFQYLYTNVTRGQNLNIQLTPGFTGSVGQMYWRVWIDFNQDGDFYDANEIVLQRQGSNSINTTINIANTALTGTTKMRVGMRAGAYPDPCETFAYGEVENYSINIYDNNAPLINLAEDLSSFEFKIRPNPVRDFMMVEFENNISIDEVRDVRIFNSLGEQIPMSALDARFEDQRIIFNTHTLRAGYYIISISDGKNHFTQSFISIQ